MTNPIVLHQRLQNRTLMKHTTKNSAITDTVKQLFRTTTRKAAKLKRKYLWKSGPDVYGRKISSTNEDMILFSEWMNRTTGSIIG